MSGFPFGVASPFMAGGSSGSSNLDNVSRICLVFGHRLNHEVPLEKLKSRLIMNQEKRMALMEKREEMRERGEDDDEDEDPVMIQGSM